MNIKLRQIRAMAEMYRGLHDGWTLHTCVHKANEAYELFKEAEAQVELEAIFGK